MAGLGCTAYRSWMHITEILDDPSTPNPEAVAMHTRLLDRAAELDIEVTGMSHEWFLPKGCKQRTGHAMPERDLTPGSLYMRALEMLEIARKLPYVRTLHNFRLLNENAMLRRAGIEQNQIGGLTEVYFGLFTDPEEGCQPRARARAIQQMTGSTTDLSDIGSRLTAVK